jgi:hypothetical protein
MSQPAPDSIAIVTVLDGGAAELLADELRQRDIPVEVRRFGVNAYLGAATPSSFEVRVPESRAEEARGVLELVALETPPPEATGWDHGALEPEPPATRARANLTDRSRPRLWIAIGLIVAIPFPVGCWYARFNRLGYLLLGTTLAAFAFALFDPMPQAFLVCAGAKAIDVVLTPLLVAVENRRRGGAESAALGASLSACFLVAIVAASFIGWRYFEEQRLEEQSSKLFFEALGDFNSGRRHYDPESRLPFPDIPLGRMHAANFAYHVSLRDRAKRIVGGYHDERGAWAAAPMAWDGGAWLYARTAGAAALHSEIADWNRAAAARDQQLEKERRHDDATDEFYWAVKRATNSDAARREDQLLARLDELARLWTQSADLLRDGSEKALATRRLSAQRQDELTQAIDEALERR